MCSFLEAFLSLFFVSDGNPNMQVDLEVEKSNIQLINLSCNKSANPSSQVWYCFRSRSGRSRSGFTDEIR